MAERLVHLEGERTVGQTPILDDDLVIGRDPEVEIYLADSRISRRHALIQPTEEGIFISDLGSSNGTLVNGELITDAVVLEPGDLIQVGGKISLVYEEGGGGATWLWAGIAVAGLAVLLAAAVFLFGGDDVDPILANAALLAADGIELQRAGNAEGGKRKINAAVRMLWGQLEDVPEQRRRQAALERMQAQLGGDVDLAAVYQSSLAASHVVERREPRGLRNLEACQLETIERADFDLCVDEHAVSVLTALWQDPKEIPPDFYEAVREQLRLLVRNRRGWVERALARGLPLKSMMEAELEAAKVPKMLRYLSMIESGYQPKIRSKAGARGLWQFMPATARQYGLRVSDQIDERTDPRKSTHAAARYLRNLAFEFGGDALLLAIASYNKGENGVRRALKKLDDPRADRSYWSLVKHDLLPTETQEYVPRLIAAAVMGEAGIPSNDAVALD
jgi:hypothetical protein